MPNHNTPVGVNRPQSFAATAELEHIHMHLENAEQILRVLVWYHRPWWQRLFVPRPPMPTDVHPHIPIP